MMQEILVEKGEIKIHIPLSVWLECPVLIMEGLTHWAILVEYLESPGKSTDVTIKGIGQSKAEKYVPALLECISSNTNEETSN